jgi:hypothetical protein
MKILKRKIQNTQQSQTFNISLDQYGLMVVMPYESFEKKLESHKPEDQEKILEVFNHCSSEISHGSSGWKEISFVSYINRKLEKFWIEGRKRQEKMAFEIIESTLDTSITTSEKIIKLLKFKEDLISSNGNTKSPGSI